MHPEIVTKNPGKCPKCHMDLLKVENAKVHPDPNQSSYKPLIVVIGLIFLVALAITSKNAQNELFSFKDFLQYLMIGFFLTFGGFKLMDLKGFADGYKTYDLLAMRLPSYGYVYPLIELFLGFSMIVLPHNGLLLVFEILIMAFSGIGVLIKLLKKERFQCACLGTFLKVPLTKITFIEDFGMAAIGIILLILTKV